MGIIDNIAFLCSSQVYELLIVGELDVIGYTNAYYLELLWVILVKEGERNAHLAEVVLWNICHLIYIDSIIVDESSVFSWRVFLFKRDENRLVPCVYVGKPADRGEGDIAVAFLVCFVLRSREGIVLWNFEPHI